MKRSKRREAIASLFFPKRCPVCDEILEPEIISGIHPSCAQKLIPVKESYCLHCGRPIVNQAREYCYECSRIYKNHPSFITSARALYLYQGDIKKTMYRFKYSNKREYATFFADRAVEKYADWIRKNQIEVIIPVPMYEKKKRLRGYNQAEVFAKALSQRTGIPIDTNFILRIKDTTPQKELNDIKRKNNLKNAFQKGKSIVQYRHILVVDDIYTTGATVEAVAQEIKNKGVCQVYALSICIGRDM